MRSSGRSGVRPVAQGAAIVLLGALGACGGGGEGAYDFNGTWNVLSHVIESTRPEIPVGAAYLDVARISQSGTSITVALEGIPPLTGTCDPEAGSFPASFANPPARLSLTAGKVDADTLSGEMLLTNGVSTVRSAVTIELVARTPAASGGGSFGIAPRALGILATRR